MKPLYDFTAWNHSEVIERGTKEKGNETLLHQQEPAHPIYIPFQHSGHETPASRAETAILGDYPQYPNTINK